MHCCLVVFMLFFSVIKVEPIHLFGRIFCADNRKCLLVYLMETLWGIIELGWKCFGVFIENRSYESHLAAAAVTLAERVECSLLVDGRRVLRATVSLNILIKRKIKNIVDVPE